MPRAYANRILDPSAAQLFQPLTQMISSLPVAAHASGLIVTLSALPPLEELAQEWRSLEARAHVSFFVSWSWIGPWLSTLPVNIRPQLVRASRGDRVLGLAVVVDSLIRDLPIPFGRAAWLHATGQPKLDGITIEHNGFLVDTDFAQSVRDGMLAFLMDESRPWRRVSMPMLGGGLQSRSMSEADTRLVLTRKTKPCWVVDLNKTRASVNGHLGLLSTKARASLRRTLRACGALGPLQVEEAKDLATARRYLASLLSLHERRWQALAVPSAFATPFAQRFHAELLSEAFNRGEVQLLRVRAGSRDMGYLYSFVHGARVSFYQSGFDYELLDSRFSIGLATLALAIEHNARQGHLVFDFLGGAAQYKQTLATDCEELLTCVVDRRGSLYETERWLRSNVLPLLHRISGNAPNTRRWLMKWVRRIAVAASVPLLLLGLDACSASLDDAELSRSAARLLGVVS
jgi:CelD/BcsL family acetyltransferase involved in cellulose biosynthesis